MPSPQPTPQPTIRAALIVSRSDLTAKVNNYGDVLDTSEYTLRK
jgi:hypothetical protein